MMAISYNKEKSNLTYRVRTSVLIIYINVDFKIMLYTTLNAILLLV